MSANSQIFEKNIEVMKNNDPLLASAVMEVSVSDDLKLHVSKTGKPSMKVGDITLHSLYDPEKEAAG